MSFRYLVLGTGVGKAVASFLLNSPQCSQVVIGDLKYKCAGDIAANLIKQFPGKKCSGIYLNAEGMPPGIFSQFNAVISALPAKHNPALAKIAIESNTHFCDLGGVTETTLRMMELNERYPDMKISIVPDCGLMPGLGIILAKKLWLSMQSGKSVQILVGGLPQKPKPPIFYQRVFSPEGLKHICYDAAPILENGKIKFVPPFYGYGQMNVAELRQFSEFFAGRIETFVTAGASIAPWTFKKWGAKNFYEKTVRWPGFVEFFKKILPDKFEDTVASTVNIPVDKNNPDLVWMKIEVSGMTNGIPVTKSVSLLDVFDPATGLTAMERTTGFSTALMAEFMAEGKTRPGVNTPEKLLNPEQLNEYLNKLNSHFTLKYTSD